MKILLIIVLTILAPGAYANDLASIYSIDLITPVSYKKDPTFEATMLSKLMAESAGALPKSSIRKFIEAAIEPDKKDLTKYFPKTGELDGLIRTVADAGIAKHLSEDVSDDNLIILYGYLGKNLVAPIADKILTGEGVSDPARRLIWTNKLLEPFNNCISTSLNFNSDAKHCLRALTSSLPATMGMAVVYELSRQHLSSSIPEDKRTSFLLGQVTLYRDCTDKTKLAFDQIIGCALDSMRTGVEKVADIALTKIIDEKASSADKANEIKQHVWPAFKSCTGKIGKANNKMPYPQQFFGCIDGLVQITGTELVLDKINNNPTIKEILKPIQVTELASAKSIQFNKCAEAQRQKGDRINGILNIAPCEQEITNQVTYNVVSETFKSTASNTLKKDQKGTLRIGNDGVLFLSKCWNDKQNAAAREECLRKAILNFSEKLASTKLDLAIPASMPKKEELNKSSVAELSKCIEKNLPKNISEAADLKKRLDDCTGKLTKSVALKVASHLIRATAAGNLPANEINKLVENLVEKEFATCIGNSPTDELLDTCTNTLATKTAKNISETSFEREVNSYLKNAGGLQSLGLVQAQVDSFLGDLTKTNIECIDRKPTSDIMDHLNACIKNSIKKIAFFFGDVQFNKSVGNMYAKREADKEKIQAQFKITLNECLEQKDGKEFTIGDYTKNLYTCSDKISSSTTLIVGTDQINSALNEYLKDRPGINLKEKRDSIRSTILGKFNSCMSNALGSATGKCIDGLKREATSLIVTNYGRTEAKAQLNTDTPLPELRLVEDQLIKCADSSLEKEELTKHLDKCMESFALGFAKELGTLKLNYLLKQTLGSTLFEAQKKEISGALEQYYDCLNGLKKYSMSEGLTQKLSICTDGLTRNGMNIVSSSVNNWMNTDKKDATTLMLKQEFATFLPCISALLPTSPYTPLLEKNINSSVKALAVLLSHYIEYNPENAKQTLDGAIARLSVDLNDVAVSMKAKHDLLDFLYDQNGIDQFMKAIIRGSVKDGLAAIPLSDVPQNLRDIMLKKEIFEDLFNTPEGTKIKEMVMETLLKPALIEGQDLKSPTFKFNMDLIKDRVIKHLIDSPQFGDQAIKLGVQHEIDNMNMLLRIPAQIWYGKAMKWENVRGSAEGKKAEAYIKEYILLPKFKGIILSAEENKSIAEEAEKLVKKAVTSNR